MQLGRNKITERFSPAGVVGPDEENSWRKPAGVRA